MPAHPNSLANLRPQRPGDPGLNPEGKNQYTYRRNFEKTMDRLLSERYTMRREPVSDGEGEKVACLICSLRNCDLYVGEQQYAHAGCVEEIDGMSRGEAIAYVTVRRAMQGDDKMLPEVLHRLWPRVEKREHELVSGDALGLADALAARSSRRRTPRSGNGSDPGAEDRGA